MTRVFVTGVGVISSVGFGRETFWHALLEGRSGASAIELFDASCFDRTVACEVKGFRPREFLTAAEVRRSGRCSQMALAAARLAVEDAGVADALRGPRTAVVIGTTMGEANTLGQLEAAWIHNGEDTVDRQKLATYGTTLLPIHIARAFGARGIVQSMPAACAAGNYAIGFAADLLRAGRADVAVCGAAEVIEKLQFAGFVRLGAVAKERCQPFDQQRTGLLVGEGAGMLILETEESVVRRGATPLAEVGGYGLACDAHHITRPHPEGTGSAMAMRMAIESSGLRPEHVDFVNAHGTGTAANDKIEAKVMHDVFGARQPLVTSVKSMLGHCMGAASAIEAVSCVLTLRDDLIPPTIHYETPDPECSLNICANETMTRRVDVVLNNSLAFGGYDAVVAFARPGVLPESAPLGRA